jgi:hypothetical protein
MLFDPAVGAKSLCSDTRSSSFGYTENPRASMTHHPDQGWHRSSIQGTPQTRHSQRRSNFFLASAVCYHPFLPSARCACIFARAFPQAASPFLSQAVPSARPLSRLSHFPTHSFLCRRRVRPHTICLTRTSQAFICYPPGSGVERRAMGDWCPVTHCCFLYRSFSRYTTFGSPFASTS